MPLMTSSSVKPFVMPFAGPLIRVYSGCHVSTSSKGCNSRCSSIYAGADTQFREAFLPATAAHVYQKRQRSRKPRRADQSQGSFGGFDAE